MCPDHCCCGSGINLRWIILQPKKILLLFRNQNNCITPRKNSKILFVIETYLKKIPHRLISNPLGGCFDVLKFDISLRFKVIIEIINFIFIWKGLYCINKLNLSNDFVLWGLLKVYFHSNDQAFTWRYIGTTRIIIN